MAPKKTLLQEVSHFLVEKTLPPFTLTFPSKKTKKKVKKMKKV